MKDPIIYLIFNNLQIFGEVDTLPANQSLFAVAVMLARPKSKGSVSLQSANPMETAIVDIKALSHPDDIWLHIKGTLILLTSKRQNCTHTSLRFHILG